MEITNERLMEITKLQTHERLFGKNICITTNNLAFALGSLVEDCASQEEASEVLRAAMFDQDGQAHIIYWPGSEYPAE
jgi:hypothetical protein